MTNDEPVTMHDAHLSIKQQLGPDFVMATHITEDRIRACATLVQNAQDAFFSDALPNLEALEKLAVTAEGEPLDTDALQMNIYGIRSLAKVLGFALIAEICVYLILALHSVDYTEEKKKLLVAKLAEALRLAFDQRIRGDGEAAGKALLENLRENLVRDHG